MACSICREEGHNRRTCSQKKDAKDNSKARARGGQPGNTNALKHGLYSDRFLPGEIEMLDLVENKIDVTHEIDMMRVVLNRVMALFVNVDNKKRVIPVEDVAQLLNSLTRGAQRIGHLVRIQHAVYGKDGGIEDALEQALMEIAEELDLA